MKFITSTAAICFFIIVLLVTSGCREPKSDPSDLHSFQVILGETMGTYYRITCDYEDTFSLKNSIDSLLAAINMVVSTYEKTSFISTINTSSEGVIISDFPKHFDINFKTAFKWYEQSEGYMDVSVMPLVNYWGFGYTPKNPVTRIDSQLIREKLQLVGLDKWNYDNNAITKNKRGQELDFSALAKGYAVDEVGRLMSFLGCENYVIDIGGELTAKGVNTKGKPWQVGISTPLPNAEMTEIALILKLENKSLATSGNYRIYYEVDGRKYGHTINPITGYPFQDSLLSVTIIAKDCIDADAIATACMAMGYKKAATFISQLPNVSACFLIGAADGTIQKKYANGFIQYTVEQ